MELTSLASSINPTAEGQPILDVLSTYRGPVLTASRIPLPTYLDSFTTSFPDRVLRVRTNYPATNGNLLVGNYCYPPLGVITDGIISDIREEAGSERCFVEGQSYIAYMGLLVSSGINGIQLGVDLGEYRHYLQTPMTTREFKTILKRLGIANIDADYFQNRHRS